MDRKKQSRSIRRFVLEYYVLFFGWFAIWLMPIANAFLWENRTHLADAAEQTAAWADGRYIGGGNVIIDNDLIAYAASKGVSEEKLRAFLSAAVSENIDPAEMLGGLEIETGLCANIGGGIAIDEVLQRIKDLPATASAAARAFWESNVTALYEIAEQNNIDVREIPGSIGAGAISCSQQMPKNFLDFGGGDFTDPFRAALYMGKHLNRSGYQTSHQDAIQAYNPGGGQAYVTAWLTAAAEWRKHMDGFAVGTEEETLPKEDVGVFTTSATFVQFVAWNMGGKTSSTIIQPGSHGEFVFPLPNGHAGYGYGWLSPVYFEGIKVIDHPGFDWMANFGDPIVAPHNGVVVFAEYLSTATLRARDWWISGNVIVIRSQFENGTPFCTLVGHGANGSIRVREGDTVQAGQHIMDVGSTGLSTGPHIHFALLVGDVGDRCRGGTFVDPRQLFSGELE